MMGHHNFMFERDISLGFAQCGELHTIAQAAYRK